jgi:nitroreductase
VAFSEEKIAPELMNTLFEAARWAPSSYNAQPWKFIWGQKGEESYRQLFELLNEANQIWAASAPVLVLGIAETISPGRRSKNKFAMYDTGMAVANLLAQATHEGLYVHQMGGYNAEKAKTVLNLHEVDEPAAMMAIGYKGDASLLPADVASRESKMRERKSLESFVFKGKL